MVAIPNSTIGYRMRDINENLHNCGIPPANSLHFFRSPSDSNLPWTGIIFGLTISSVWYWCTDQVGARPGPPIQREVAEAVMTVAGAARHIMSGERLGLWFM